MEQVIQNWRRISKPSARKPKEEASSWKAKRNHSARRLFTGFSVAAFNDCRLIVNIEITKAPAPVVAKIHQGNPVLY